MEGIGPVVVILALAIAIAALVLWATFAKGKG